MYTSGSTGNPKGVILSHKNILCTLISIARTLQLKVCFSIFLKKILMWLQYFDFTEFFFYTAQTYPNDAYLAFLPMAHVLELLCESCMLGLGVKIGYSTPNTLTDNSS